MHAPVHDVEAGRPDPGRRGPSRRRSSQLEALVETGRRLSKAHAPSQPEAGVLLNVALIQDGDEAHVGELQMHIAAILEEKKAAHVSYGIARGLGLD